MHNYISQPVHVRVRTVLAVFVGSTGILSIIVSYLEATGKPAGGAAQRRVEVHHFLAHVVADAHVEGALVAAAVARAAVGVCDESVRKE